MSSQSGRACATRHVVHLLVCAAALAMSTACVGRHALAVRQTDRHPDGISWFAPTHAGDALTLEKWRASVGPAVVAQRASQSTTPADALTIVSWNTHLGAGDVERLVAALRKNSPGVPIVLLLQEVYRAGPEVPTLLSPAATFASRIRAVRADGRRDEVETVAAALGMSAYYVPSMRNGSPLTSDEDRGNAILSTLPLSNLSAFELPFERQRRVAVGANLTGMRPNGAPWELRVVSAHLDNMAGPRRLWVAGEFARVRQTRGLLSQLDFATPTVLAGDFNTWFGFNDEAFREASRAFPETPVSDRRATFRGIMRLDHMFFRLPRGWSARFARADDNYGSDHYPLIATIALD